MKYLRNSRRISIISSVAFVLIVTACTLESDYLDAIAQKIQQESLGDPLIPDEVSSLKITEAGAGEITIIWTDPEEPTYSHAEINWTPDGVDFETVSRGENTFTLTHLGYGQKYYITVVAVTESGGRSEGVTIGMTIPDSLTSINCITTAEELADINGSIDLSGYYLLLNDISLIDYSTGEGWTPIGSYSKAFIGTFDGNEYEISDLYLNRSTAYNGLFGYVLTGTIINLRLTSAAVHCQSADFVGGLAGEAIAGSVIKNILVSGDVSGSGATGGVVGAFAGDLQKAYYGGSVTSETGNAGGLIGEHQEGPVSNSYAIATVHSSTGSYAGGIMGTSTNGDVSFCYAKSNVTGAANLDGLIPNYAGTNVASSYFDAQFFSASPAAISGTDKTTSEMKNQTTYTGWDFINIWSIDTSGTINGGYPYLTGMIP